jgi:hypothetical protein
LIQEHYGWYVGVEPDSGDYFIDADRMQAHKKVLETYPDKRHFVYCLNETGTTGRI